MNGFSQVIPVDATLDKELTLRLVMVDVSVPVADMAPLTVSVLSLTLATSTLFADLIDDTCNAVLLMKPIIVLPLNYHYQLNHHRIL